MNFELKPHAIVPLGPDMEALLPPTKIPFMWEALFSNSTSGSSRAKVFGGWIIMTQIESQIMGEYQSTISTIFIPDPFHQWSVEG